MRYESSGYVDPSARVGAGVEGDAANGYRVVSGSCSTFGVTGGFTQAGGHSPLPSSYSLGAEYWSGMS